MFNIKYTFNILEIFCSKQQKDLNNLLFKVYVTLKLKDFLYLHLLPPIKNTTWQA